MIGSLKYAILCLEAEKFHNFIIHITLLSCFQELPLDKRKEIQRIDFYDKGSRYFL